MKLSSYSWEKVLRRWCDFPPSGEVDLICAVLADGIVERHSKDTTDRMFMHGGFDAYCRVIGLDPEFVRQQIARADDATRPNVELCGAPQQEKR